MVIAGVDVGGTKVAVCLASEEGHLVRLRLPVVRTGEDISIPEQCLHLLSRACQAMGQSYESISKVGIGACGPIVNRDGFRALAAPNLCGGLSNNPSNLPNQWQSIPIEAWVSQHFSGFELQMDVVAALQAERLFGAAQHSDHCIYGTWSTGLGFGLCVDGRLLSGKNGNAGHAGHHFLPASAHENNSENAALASCGCGNIGDAESLFSGTGLARAWGRPPEQVFAMARRGNRSALAQIDRLVESYSFLLYNLSVTLDIELIILGGSVYTQNQELLLPRLRQALCRSPRQGMQAIMEQVTIKSAQLGEMVADIGALSLVMPPHWVERWRSEQPWLHCPTTNLE